jgi:hypothetical protein
MSDKPPSVAIDVDDLSVSLLSALWRSMKMSTGAWWVPARVGAPIRHTKGAGHRFLLESSACGSISPN